MKLLRNSICIMVFYVEKMLLYAKIVVLPENQLCFNHPDLLENYDTTVRDGLSRVRNVNFDDISSTQLALPSQMILGLFLHHFYHSAFGWSNFLSKIFI